jgi:glutamyl/glutaminyl-tRNA synthetase
VEMEVGDLNDFIIAKNIDEPLYHLAVVVDDIESGVSHIIRGEDHISNTPRQILIARALGKKDDFIYAHLPLVLAKDKSKLSKRKHGELVSLNFYRDRGYSKEAILNFMALIGWNPGTDQEIFSLEELVKEFNLSKVQKKGAIFDIKKLEWMNRAYLLKQAKDIQISNLKSQILETKRKDSERWKETEFVEKFLKIVLDRIHRWREVRELLDNGEFDYLFESSGLIPEKLIWKTDSKEKTKESLEKVLEVLENKEEIMKLAEKVGKGSVLWPLRYALSGREKSPDPMTLIDILGIEESKKRIEKAIKII